MRIVAVADTHTFQSDLGDLPAGDMFVHAGDMCRRGSLDELEPVAAWIHSLSYRYKVVVAGNHDWCFVKEPDAARSLLGPDIIYLEDEGATIDGIRLWGSPWQPAFNDWAFNLPRGAPLAEKWALIPDTTDVLITHGPPLGIGDRLHDPAMRDADHYLHRTGCDELKAAVARVAPAMHLFGHIHQDGGLWQQERTTYANVTTWECERSPSVVDFDPATGTVTPVHIPPRI